MSETTPPANRPLAGLRVVESSLLGPGLAATFLADLGVGPWDVLHDALAGLIDRQPGTVIIGLGLVLLVLVAALRQPIGPATVANVVIIGSTVNALMAVVEPPSSAAVRALLVVTAPILVAFGTMLYLGAGLGTGVRDGLMTALVDAGLSIRTARTCLEVTVLVGGGRWSARRVVRSRHPGLRPAGRSPASGIPAPCLGRVPRAGRLGLPSPSEMTDLRWRRFRLRGY